VKYLHVPFDFTERVKSRDTHRNQVCVVALLQPRMTSSVVVTLVHVMHKDTSCPARRARVNLLVHRLLKRAQKLEQKAEGDA
jgi:hypothetical protein